MKRYIEHLLEDLETLKIKAVHNLSTFYKVAISSDYELYHDDEHVGIKLADLIGMEQFFFPNIDYITDDEAEKIVVALIDVYHAHGFNPMFEQCVSDRIKYGHLRNGLNQQVFPVENQIVDVEMCDYLPQYCPFYLICSHHNAQKVCCVSKNRA